MVKIMDVLSFISLMILMSTFVLVANKRVNSYIRTFRLQSLLLALAAAMIGIYHLIYKHELDGVFIIFILTLVLKVIYMPDILQKITSRVEYRVEKDFFINIPVSIIISCAIVILSWFVISKIPEIDNAYNSKFLIHSLSVVLIGLFFMISRKKAIGQIIGFLVIENGIFTAAMLVTMGMPMIVEFGVFFDMLAAFLIMGVFVLKISKSFDSIGIDRLNKLKG